MKTCNQQIYVHQKTFIISVIGPKLAVFNIHTDTMAVHRFFYPRDTRGSHAANKIVHRYPTIRVFGVLENLMILCKLHCYNKIEFFKSQCIMSNSSLAYICHAVRSAAVLRSDLMVFCKTNSFVSLKGLRITDLLSLIVAWNMNL